MLRWKCHICGEERPDHRISVRKTDVSKSNNLPEGTMYQNVRYCNDRKKCVEESKTFSFFRR